MRPPSRTFPPISAVLSCNLEDIIVEVYEDGPSDYIRRKMENYGWIVSTIEYVEEWGSDRSFGDFEDDWDDGDDDNDDLWLWL